MTRHPAGSVSAGASHRWIGLVLFGLVIAYVALLATTFTRGIWLVGRDGSPIATDFVSFWSAGKLVLEGRATQAYDWLVHKETAAANGIAIKGYFSFQYPPTFLLLTPIFALVSYPLALVLWNAVGIALYAWTARVITGGWNATLAMLAWPAVLWNCVVGQTGFLTAALLGTGIALIERRPVVAGVMFGLLTYKPQFGLLIPIALFAGRCWTVILSAIVTAIAFAALSAAVFGTGAWTAFGDSILRINEAILTSGGTDFSKLQSFYGYGRAMGLDSGPAWIVHGMAVLVLAVFLAWTWNGKASFPLKAAALAICTILASPYAYVYDLVALAVPLAFLGVAGFSRREMPFVAAAGALVAWGPADHLATGLMAGLIILGVVAARCVPSRQHVPAP